MLLRGDDFSPAAIVVKFAVLIFSLTVHEFAHAWSAYRCGDQTAARMGRMTLNPLAHLDFLGTIMILFAPIGWAKPVPVNPSRMRKPRRDDMIVSMAGPFSNICLAVLSGLALRGLTASQGNLLNLGAGEFGVMTAVTGILAFMVWLNLGLAFFNMIPLFPLDGSHVLENLLPLEAQMKYLEIRPYLPYVLLALILFTPVLNYVVLYPIAFIAPGLTGYDINGLWALKGFVNG